MKNVIYAGEPLTKEQTCAKFDLTEEQREARLSLGPIQEIWTIKSHEKAEVMKAFNTFSDCRVCDKFTETVGNPPSETQVPRVESRCPHCGHEDAYVMNTDYTKNGITFTITFEDMRPYKHSRAVH